VEYKNNPNPETLLEIENTLQFIRQHSIDLVEKEGDSKWTQGHTVFAFDDDDPGMYTFMVGALKNGAVTWHMMPMYGVSEMKEKWTESLAPYVSGKSCINFKRFSELPQEALRNIVSNGTPLFQKEMQAYYAKRKKKK
jgi:hypothetical protein